MAFCVLPFLSIFLWVSLSFAQNGVTFLYPTKGLEFYYLDTVNVTWTSNFTTPFLFTFCSNPNKTVLTMDIKSNVPINGSALVVLSYKDVTPCWFDLRPSKNPGGANSPSFVLKATQRSQTTIGLSPSSTESTTSTGTSSTSATASNTNPPAGGLSGGAKAGIGVGVALVAIAVLGGLGVFLYMRRKKNSINNAGSKNTPPGWTDMAGTSQGMATNGAYRGIDTNGPYQEIDTKDLNQSSKSYGDYNRSELSSDWRGHELDTIHSPNQVHELPVKP